MYTAADWQRNLIATWLILISMQMQWDPRSRRSVQKRWRRMRTCSNDGLFVDLKLRHIAFWSTLKCASFSFDVTKPRATFSFVLVRINNVLENLIVKKVPNNRINIFNHIYRKCDIKYTSCRQLHEKDWWILFDDSFFFLAWINNVSYVSCFFRELIGEMTFAFTSNVWAWLPPPLLS